MIVDDLSFVHCFDYVNLVYVPNAFASNVLLNDFVFSAGPTIENRFIIKARLSRKELSSLGFHLFAAKIDLFDQSSLV